jgi:hypothetical protein
VRGILLLLFMGGLLTRAEHPPARVVAVASGPDGAAHIALDGKTLTIRKERGQAGIGEAKIAPNGSVGWLVEYDMESLSYRYAGKLVLWRAGKVIRRFDSGQSFYSWNFYADGRQVAYHTGPLHGERNSHCELHDIANGRLLAVWDGDIGPGNDRPAWTKGLAQ